jgi:hypothetical protein
MKSDIQLNFARQDTFCKPKAMKERIEEIIE